VRWRTDENLIRLEPDVLTGENRITLKLDFFGPDLFGFLNLKIATASKYRIAPAPIGTVDSPAGRGPVGGVVV